MTNPYRHIITIPVMDWKEENCPKCGQPLLWLTEASHSTPLNPDCTLHIDYRTHEGTWGTTSFWKVIKSIINDLVSPSNEPHHDMIIEDEDIDEPIQ
jgi:hypothetical protein